VGGDPLDGSTQAVGHAAREVEQAAGEVAIEALQVDDHRLALLEPVADLLRVVERLGGDDVGLGGRARQRSHDAADPGRLGGCRRGP
jgi:hypothetical protein